MVNSTKTQRTYWYLALSLLAAGLALPANAETADSFLANKRSREHQPQFKPITKLKIKPAESCPRSKCENHVLLRCLKGTPPFGRCSCRKSSYRPC